MRSSRTANSANDSSIRQARRLLHTLCTCDPLDAQVESIAHVLEQPVDWPYAVECGARHKMLPLLNHVLKHAPLDLVHSVPLDVRRMLMVAGVESEIICRKQIALLKRLLEAFVRQNLPVMVVKGLTLATLYHQPSLRPCGDIDLIVHEQNWPAVAAMLRELDLKPLPHCAMVPNLSPELVLRRASYFAHGQVIYRAACGILVEIHFRLLNIGVPAAVEDAWERLRFQPLGDLLVPTVSCSEAIVYQALHMHGHYCSRLIWFTDLFLMLKTWKPVDWERIKQLTRQWRIQQTLPYVFDLFEELGGSLGELIKAADFMPSGKIRRLLYQQRWPKEPVLRLERESPFGAAFCYYLLQRASWPERFRFVWETLFPPRACLGDESRRAYWARFLANTMPRLHKLLNLQQSSKG